MLQSITGSDGLSIRIETFKHGGGVIASNLKRGYCTRKEADVLESFVLALACEGVALDERFERAIQTTLEALANAA